MLALQAPAQAFASPENGIGVEQVLHYFRPGIRAEYCAYTIRCQNDNVSRASVSEARGLSLASQWARVFSKTGFERSTVPLTLNSIFQSERPEFLRDLVDEHRKTVVAVTTTSTWRGLAYQRRNCRAIRARGLKPLPLGWA